MKSLMVALGVAVVFICLDMTLAAMMGEECGIDSQCPNDDNVECKIYVGCDNGTCQCKTGYVADGQACKRIRTYGQECGDTDMCTGPATECTDSACACPADHEWDSNKNNCFLTATTYVAIGQPCDAVADCSSRDTANAAGYACVTAEEATEDTCACAENYEHDTATDKCQMTEPPTKAYNDAVCVVTDNDCADTTVCRAVSADDTTLKCLCAEAAGDVAAKKWNSRLTQCVDGDAKVDVAQDGVCDTHTDCTGSLECVRCGVMTTGDMNCRAVDTDTGNSGGTSGAEQVIAGFVTLILSAVAMLF